MQEDSLYIQIYKKILQSIECGEYTENAPLPSERILCEIHHVSRSTIRQAMKLLKDTDVIYTVQGNGTFIKPQVFTQPLTSFYSFTDTLKNSDIIIQNTIISYEKIKADSHLSKKTLLPIDTELHKIVRLRSAKEYPLMIETSFLPCARFIKINLDILSKSSLYEYLKLTYNFSSDKIKEDLRPIIPDNEQRNLLQMPINTPCIFLERYSFEDDLISEYTQSVVRGDKYIFHVELNASN